MRTHSLQLEKAYKLVNTHWFPYDQAILKQLSTKVEEEDVVRDDLLSLIKKDASLFLLCLKEILSAPPLLKPWSNDQNIPRLLEDATIEQIKYCVSEIKNRPISHLKEAASEGQKQRLSEMVVSCMTANKLTKDSNELNEISFSCSLMRQLGLTLIAWNYPRIFDKITSKTHSKDSLSSEFAEVLGFTPTMLACTVLEKWGVPKNFIEAVSDKSSPKAVKKLETAEEDKKDLFARASNICAIGEALSRATNPSLYNTAEEDLQLASAYIEDVAGLKAVIEIIADARDQLQTLALDVPPLLLVEKKDDLDRNLKSTIQGSALINNNPYLTSFPRNIYSKVTQLYQEVIPNNPTYKSVSIYAKEIYPLTGLSTLQVYLLDPLEMRLYPSLVLGKSKTLSPKALYLNSTSSQYDILVEALKTKMPITYTQFINKEEEELTLIAASLGDTSTVGVLYMEILQSTYRNLAAGNILDTLKYFKGLKILLSDCLGLR